jgi:ribosomal protein S18 acetylase RimI-like enzyme
VQPVDIRILTPADASAWWHLRLEALETEPESFGSSAEEHRSTSVADTAARLGSDPANNFAVGAFVEGDLVGMAGFYRERGLKVRHKGNVWGVYVTGRQRGAGIGRMIMDALLARASLVEGVEHIVLMVTTTQEAAMSLYHSLGFRSFGCERRAIKIGGRYFDTEHMVRYLGDAPALTSRRAQL